MPRRSVIVSCLVAGLAQVSSGCCWRPFAHCWAGYSCAPCVAPAPIGCSSCGSSPIAAGPVMAGPMPVATVGYPVAAPSVAPGAGSVFTAPPSQPLPAPKVTQEGLPMSFAR